MREIPSYTSASQLVTYAAAAPRSSSPIEPTEHSRQPGLPMPWLPRRSVVVLELDESLGVHEGAPHRMVVVRTIPIAVPPLGAVADRDFIQLATAHAAGQLAASWLAQSGSSSRSRTASSGARGAAALEYPRASDGRRLRAPGHGHRGQVPGRRGDR